MNVNKYLNKIGLSNTGAGVESAPGHLCPTHVYSSRPGGRPATSHLRLLWHYTIAEKLERIFDEQCIRVATVGVEPDERPAVWFSANQIWEATSAKGLYDPVTGETFTATYMRMQKMGLRRIGVLPSVAPVSWAQFKLFSGISRRKARGLEKVARSVASSPKDWHVSFEPVPASRWAAVQQWEGMHWCDMPIGQPLRLKA